mgnify:CR=1 FL=1
MTHRYARLLPEHDIVVLSDYAKGALSSCAQFIRMAREAGKPVLVDPKGRHMERYAGATLLKPNLAEFTGWVGEPDDESHFCRLAHALRQRPAECVGRSTGREGHDEDQWFAGKGLLRGRP